MDECHLQKDRLTQWPHKFQMYFPQDSTFTFIDVAPQWQSFNAGNWLDVENGVRYLAQYLYGTLNVTRT